MNMMFQPAAERGRTQIDWLKSQHTFSFGGYYDPQFMGFGPLRVINDDRVTPGAGFGTHGHRDMEIISYVLDGALAHEDSTGSSGVIRPGEIQLMRAGTGIRHSEYNDSKTDPVHFLQIWIEPNRMGLQPGYDQKPTNLVVDQVTLVASRDGRNDTIRVHQDADLHAALISKDKTINFAADPGRRIWVHVAEGDVSLGDTPLSTGDGVGLVNPGTLNLTGLGDTPAHVLLFDLPA